jgi:hypothetical protein
MADALSEDSAEGSAPPASGDPIAARYWRTLRQYSIERGHGDELRLMAVRD